MIHGDFFPTLLTERLIAPDTGCIPAVKPTVAGPDTVPLGAGGEEEQEECRRVQDEVLNNTYQTFMREVVFPRERLYFW